MSSQLSKRQGFEQHVHRVITERCMEFLESPEAATRLQKLVLAMVPKSPKLLECTPASVALCLMHCAELGLEPSSTLGHVYLIPRYSSKTRSQECSFLVGYKGYMELARRSGDVRTMYAGVVYAGEEFAINISSAGVEVSHKPSFDVTLDRSPEAVVASYVIMTTRSGGTYTEWCTKAEIDERRKAGGSKGFSPWSTHFDRMARKSAIRKLFDGGTVPLSPQMARANEIEMMAEIAELRMRRTEPREQPRPPRVMPALELIAKPEDGPPVDGLFLEDQQPQPEPEP